VAWSLRAGGVGPDETFDHFTEVKILSSNDTARFGALKLA
jgi:hypothetical protein